MSLNTIQINNECAIDLYSKLEEIVSIEIKNKDTIDEEKTKIYKVKEFRLILEKLFSELAKNMPDSELINHAARMEYVFKTSTADNDIRKKCYSLRAQLNPFHHYGYPDSVSNEKYLILLKTLCQIINYFSKCDIPRKLKDIYQSVAHLELPDKPEIPKEKIEFVQASIYKIKKENNQLYITCIDQHNLNYMHIYINKNNSLFIHLKEVLWENATINIFNIFKTPDKPFYSVNPQSFFIIEPDYLINITQIKECFVTWNKVIPSLYLLNKFELFKPSIEKIQGNIANFILDTLVFTGNTKFDDLFNKATREYAFDIVSSVKAEDLPETIRKLKENSEKHFNSIITFVNSEKVKNIKTSKTKSNNLIHIEPYVISHMYGLSGRFDILLEYQRDDTTVCRDIIELKSTKNPPKNDAPYINDNIQVFCYDIMLNSMYPDRVGESLVLYSSKQDNCLISIKKNFENNPNINITQDIVKARNCIVHYEYLLAKGELLIDSIVEVIKNDVSEYKSFKKDFADGFINTINNLENNLEKKYINNFLQFIAKEQWINKLGKSDDIEYNKYYGFSSLWKLDINEKQDHNIIFADLEYDEANSNLEQLTVCFKRNLFNNPYLSTVFREGDVCIIYPQDSNLLHSDDPTKKIFLKATIATIESDTIIVKLRNLYPSKNYFKKHSTWCIEQDLTDSFSEKLSKSLYEFAKCDKDKKELLLGLKEPQFEDPNTYNVIYTDDHIIKTAIEKSVSCKDYFLIQGPPGTAKTSIVLINIVKHIYNTTQENIFIMAYTNRAVDEICENLIKHSINFIRLGRGFKYPDYNLDHIKYTMDIYQLYNKIHNCRIFVSTVHSAYESPIFNMKSFHTAIIDEASQLLEPHIIGILTRFNRFIMIGDEKQLPPVVVQEQKNVDDDELKKISLYSLSNSLFERLLLNAKRKKWDNASIMLQKHYRMHEEIADFVNTHYYNNLLKIGSNSQKQAINIFKSNFENKIERLLSKHRIIFIQSDKDKGKTNKYEANIVKDIVKVIINVSNDFTEKTVGIITPFRAQINLIRKTLFDSQIPKEIIDKITIDTVERFQGSERDIIIVSFSLNSYKNIDLISSLTFNRKVDRKLNVTLTRAREHLILTGCAQVLEHSQHYKDLLNYIKQKGGFVESKIL